MDSEAIIPLKKTLFDLPPEVPSANLAEIIAQRQKASTLPLLVVLDDDPTGTQTCHGINVLTVWDQQTLVDEFKATQSGFFILTNSRALHTPEARKLIKEISLAVKEAATIAGKQFEFVLRSDSTLRGHFPDEPEVAEEVVGAVDGWVIAPFFRQGGRLTINDIHYVADYASDKLVPAAQTPFAKDASFGYKNSDLKKYVVEKSKGRIGEDRIKSISLEDIRDGGPSAVAQKLQDFPQNTIVIVNAVVDTDMEIFMQGLLEISSQGKRYIYRTGAAFVSSRLGIEQIPPLTPADLDMDTTSPSSPGGLIIAGSYVPKTTSQLESLISGRGANLHTITLEVEPLLASSKRGERPAALTSAVSRADDLISHGHDVLLMTSRDLVTGHNEASSLQIGAVVAAALVDFLSDLSVRPRYVIAKGGITSSDAATKGLRMRRAEVVGQAASGVPLWRCQEESSKFVGIPYVVFPGNVGEVDTLRDLVAAWAKTSA